MSSVRFTVACVDHGAMERNQARLAWYCPDESCEAWLPDEDVHRLVTDAPSGGPDPVPLVVT